MSCSECDVASLYCIMCCSVNGSVCLVCCVFLNKQFEHLEFVFYSVYVDLQYDEISLTFTTGSVSLCCVCGLVVVFGLYVRLSWYPMWMRWLL